jgi:hypothetical protein
VTDIENENGADEPANANSAAEPADVSDVTDVTASDATEKLADASAGDPSAVASGAETSTDHLPGRQRSAAIYGTIITAAVLAAGGNALSTVALEATVFVTVMVYWLAEQYAVLLGEHTHSGQLPSKAEILHSMRASFPMVTSSLIPLLVLFIARACGLTAFHAAAVAIFVTVVLLIYHGHAAGREAGLTGAKLVLVTATAGLLGVIMIALKTLLQHQHHLY